MRTIGRRDRTEFTLDPVEAFRRGRALDAMFASGLPRVRGLLRGSAAVLGAEREARERAAARRVAAAPRVLPLPGRE